MTVAKGALELYINLNITLVVACFIWILIRSVLVRSALRQALFLQNSLLKTLLLLVALSPALAVAAAWAIGATIPGSSIVLSDIAVAAFLRGELGSDAVLFDSVLRTRSNWTVGLLTADSPVFILLSAALIGGAVWAFCRILVSAYRLRAILEESHFWKRIGTVELRLSDSVIVPFAARGLVRRYIVLPVDLLADKDARRMALAHELQHFRQGDLEWELGFEFVRPFFFWNPAFIILKRQFDRLRELTCDHAVITKHEFAPLDYARCLLDFCERSVGKRQQNMLNVALVTTSRRSARTELANRLISLKSIKAHSQLAAWKLALVAMPLLVFISVVGASLQTAEDWSQDRLTLSTIVNLERLEILGLR